MADSPSSKQAGSPTVSVGSKERLVYIMPEGSVGAAVDDEITFRELWEIVWQGKWVIFAITTMFALGSVVYALTATEWYRAEALLSPAEARSAPSLSGQLGGLAALAGVSVEGGETPEAVATLKSRELARQFIESNGLMPVLLYEKWDHSRKAWIASEQEDIPDVRDAVRLFHDNVLKVQEARDSGLVTVAIEWVDPLLAAEWATHFVSLANDRLRQRALEEAETNVAYLQAELASTTIVTLQQSIGRLLEAELQKLMLARGNQEFAFRTVDAAEPPKEPVRPRRAVVAMLGTLMGGILSLIIIFLRHSIRAP
jgi:uncharacterized protein involved in exopolysaccharide biosynthesis